MERIFRYVPFFIEKVLDNYCKGSYYYNINIARAIIERSDYY